MGQDPNQIRQEIEETRSEMGHTVDALAYKTDVKSRVKESIGEKRDRLLEQVRGTGGRMSSQLHDTAASVGEATPDGQQIKQGAKQAVGVAEENPIGLALGGVAAGFLVGMMLPSSRLEDERVGPIADQVKETAVETGKDALDRGKDVAGQVAQDAMASARETGQQAVETAKETGQQAVETVKEAGREQADELKQSAEEMGQSVGDQSQGGESPAPSRPGGG